MPYTFLRGQCATASLPEFQGFVGECFEGIAKFPVCWQFCWQLPTCLSQPPDAQASKLEPVVGLEPTTDGLQNRCSTTELNWLLNLNRPHESVVPTGVGVL